MKNRRHGPAFSGEKQKRFLIFCMATALCLSQVARAQSGRRKDKQPSPSSADSQAVAPVKMLSILVGGIDIDPDTKEVWSTYRGTIAKACIARLKERPGPALKVIDGGKMTRTEAFESAKRQTDAYVLWFGYRSTSGLSERISYVDYRLLLPQTAEILTEGRVLPNLQKTTVDPGGVMRLPTIPGQRRSISMQLDVAGRQVADHARAKL